MNPRLYVLIDAQYPAHYRAVQGTHAAVEHALKYPDLWKNQTIVMLKTCDLPSWKQRLVHTERTFVEFREPDVGNKITAIALVDDGKMFRKLELS